MALQEILSLQFTGTDGSTSVQDTSPSNLPITCSGGAAVDVIAPGDARLLLAPGGLCYTPDNPVLSLAQKDWEIRVRVRCASAPGNMAIISQFNGSDGNDCFELTHKSGAGLRLLMRRGGGTILDLTQSGAPLAASTDYDVVVKRAGSSATVSRNGVIVLSGTMSGDAPDPTSPFYLGYSFYSYGQSVYGDAWLDNVQVLKDDAEPPPPPPPVPAWRAGVPVVCRHAPLSTGPNGSSAAVFLFINTTVPSTYAPYPMTTYPAPGLFVPQSWHRLNVKQMCGIPAGDEILAVKIGGIIGLTMGNTAETGDLHIHLRAPGSGNNNYVFQTDAVNAGGGDRDNAGPAPIAVVNDEIEFAWWVSSPALDYPQHAGYFFNLNLAEYIRALPP